jgi:hypothetical protein
MISRAGLAVGTFLAMKTTGGGIEEERTGAGKDDRCKEKRGTRERGWYGSGLVPIAR